MKKWSIYILALLLLLGACTNEEYDPVGPTPNSDDLTLTIRFPQSSLATKALTIAEENKVDTLWVLVYTKAASGNYLDDEFAHSFKFTGSAIATSTTLVTGDTKQVSFTMPNSTSQQRFILLANLPNGTISPTDTAQNAPLSTLVGSLDYANASTWQQPNISSSTPGFPMWGQMPDYVTFTAGTTPTIPVIKMIRALARIDVGVNIGGLNDPALGFGDIFKIQNVYLCNPNTSGHIAPHNWYLSRQDSLAKEAIYLTNADNIPNTTPVNPVVNPESVIDYGFTVTQGQTDSIMMRTIYTPEADTILPGSNPTFLVVKAEYYGAETYYRIDFANNGVYVPLLRNTRYEINIVGARKSGYATLQEALDAHPSLNNPNLIFNVTETTLNGVITNEQYMLAYEASEIYVDWNESINFSVKTNYAGGITVPAGYTLSGTTGDVQKVTRTLARNTTGLPDTLTVTISAGTLTKEITIIQSAGSNSYVVLSGNPVDIPITFADPTLANVDVSVSKLWEEGVSVNIQKQNLEVLTVTPTGPGEGNVVVVITHPATNVTLYSWHIWFVTTDPRTTNLYSNNGYTFMSRNLGAVTAGGAQNLYYQWGRKDPFTETVAAAKLDTIDASMTLAKSIENPDVFYASVASPFDWVAYSISNQNNNYWNTSTNEKGRYDPCPFGWRVPPADAWSGHGVTLPASGYLDMTSGQKVGTASTVWGASARGMSAYLFYGGDSQSFRANAYPVRCVKDVKR